MKTAFVAALVGLLAGAISWVAWAHFLSPMGFMDYGYGRPSDVVYGPPDWVYAFLPAVITAVCVFAAVVAFTWGLRGGPGP